MAAFRRLCRVLGIPMALVLVLTSFPLRTAQAGLIGTEQALSNAAKPNDSRSQRARIVAFLHREDVRRQIQALGVDPHEADARVATLSDAEVAKLAGRIDQLPAGAGAEIFIVLGVIFLVLVVLDLIGVTHIFKVFR